MLGGGHQQGVGLATAQHPETLPSFHPVQKSTGLLMQLFGGYRGHLANRHQLRVTVNLEPLQRQRRPTLPSWPAESLAFPSDQQRF